MQKPPAVTVVLATRDRRDLTIETVARLRALPERPPLIVVDDGSTDGTAVAVRARCPDVTLLRMPHPTGVTAARNVGVRAADTPYVALCDDDSWWATGAMAVIEQTFARHPRLGVIAAKVLVGGGQRLDPTCAAMASSPLPSDGLPGPRVLGFVACGAAVRREAFLTVGGFPEEYVIGGEEEPLALALAAAGWDAAYVDTAVAHHAPAEVGRRPSRRDRNVLRNDLWTAWRYRRGSAALRRTVELLRSADTPAKWVGVMEAVAAAPRVLRQRRPVPEAVEAQRALLDAPRKPGGP